jgi:hypothetical protein
MTVSITPIESGDDLARSEDDFFNEIVLSRSADPHQDWENQANAMGGLLPGEKFHLRFVEKNFDGRTLGRWIVFCGKPPCSAHPGRHRIITVMTIEPPGEAGVFATPSNVHLDGLAIVLHDWREGRHAALERLEEMHRKESDKAIDDAFSDAHGRVDDAFWIWKRAMGESVDLRLGSDGKGPNHGGRYFGKSFLRDDADPARGGIYLP